MTATTTVLPMTYRDLLRIYARNVRNGTCDADLAPRERRLVEVMLNLASNTGHANFPYPPTAGRREDVAQYFGEIIWNSSPLVDACSSASSKAFDRAAERALEVIRNI